MERKSGTFHEYVICFLIFRRSCGSCKHARLLGSGAADESATFATFEVAVRDLKSGEQL